MSAAAHRGMPHDSATALAHRHRNTMLDRRTRESGRRISQRLDVRLDTLTTRIAALPGTVHAQFIGIDWLDQNLHVVRESTQQIAINLPKAYVRKLPTVESLAGRVETRAHELAAAIVEECELPLDQAWIEQFIDYYQAESPLTLGELWALPTYFRALIVTRLCDAISAGLTIAETDADEQVRARVSAVVPGCIISLRTIAATDWLEFVERVSIVERVLGEDPAGAYAHMTAASRNHYRERVEGLARELHCAEQEIAQTTVAMSREQGSRPRASHVGFYLADAGLDELRARIRGRQPPLRRLRAHADRIRAWSYLLVICGGTVLSLLLLARLVVAAGASPAATWILVLVAFVPAITIVTNTVNWLITQVLPPRVLPKLDFSRRIPAEQAAIVAVPCMLTDLEGIDRLIANLEINYLGNSDPALAFVLLSDFRDADAEQLDGDVALLNRVRDGIDTLNARYGENRKAPFSVLHRRRAWNPNAGIWMGWERKRGKIDKFNRWLRGESDTEFLVLHGGTAQLRNAKYVITLDADNQLLPGVAAQLIGTHAHPLNRPVYDDDGRLAAGYSLIQPRVDLHPASANRSAWSRLMSGDVGIDLYHAAVSEVYQDLFGRGIYAGKGSYDIDAFAASVEGCIPDNTVLSHDLLEGILGRAALASDIIVLENASTSFVAELKRQHRWIRGDWQLLPWLVPRVARPGARLDLLGRFKLVDNLRRSLLPPSLLVLFFAGWIVLPEHRLAWSSAVALVPAIRMFSAIASDLANSALRWGTLRSTLIRVTASLGRQVGAWLVNLVMLPAVAYMSADAISRTLVRVFVTRRRLLEWTPFAATESHASGRTLASTMRQTLAAPIAGLGALGIAVYSPPAFWPALFAFAWAGAPLLAWLLAREPRPPRRLNAAERARLRKLARLTWQFYERYVGPEHHWLPPDNFQEAPHAVLAPRTSPTNIGLFLVSAVAARDLMYLGARALMTRIDGTTATLMRLPRFRGHLYNWYDTRLLSILEPAYVSTVDSGNLLAALFICRTALLEIEVTPAPHHRARSALGDVVANIEDMIAGERGGKGGKGVKGGPGTVKALGIVARMRQRLAETSADVADWQQTLAQLHDVDCTELDGTVLEIAETRGPAWSAAQIEALRSWITQLRYEARVLMDENAVTCACLGDMERLRVQVSATDLESLGRFARKVGEACRQLPADDGQDDAASFSNLRKLAREFDEIFTLRDQLLVRIGRLIDQTEFGFLFDEHRQLFHIGYNNTTGRLDTSYYDLLASEARTASLIAIAKGDVPVSHWVHLGRPLRRIDGMRVLMSWSATAFEYLMPRLFMRTPPHTLLDASCRAMVGEQRRLARHRHVPWGISESAYYDLDASGNYKYHAFGVPSLALRRSTRERYVVSPYASVLALPYDPAAVLDNLTSLESLGIRGRYGLYEALDFGEQRDASRKPRLVQSYMAHHQGMIVAALANALCGDSLVRRFHANPEIATIEHLLFEALPKRAEDRVIRDMPPVRPRVVPLMTSDQLRVESVPLERFVNVVGNGHVTVRTTGCGGGDTSWNGNAVTRWLPRTGGACSGERLYVSDADSGAIFVLGDDGPPAASPPEVWCSPHDTEIHQRLDALFARATIAVAPENDVVFKSVRLTNESGRRRRLMITHYAELALAPSAADRRHPAFNKLFIESETVGEPAVLVFGRRKRSAGEAGFCCAVAANLPDGVDASLDFTADRLAFLGRAGRYDRPAALDGNGFNGNCGTGLDPAAALGVRLTLPPGVTAEVTFVTALAPDRDQALGLIGHFRSPDRVRFNLDLARRRAAAELTELSLESKDVARLMQTYSELVWPRPLTARAQAEAAGAGSILGFLWSRGISGDNPICVAPIDGRSLDGALDKLLAFMAYLGDRGVAIDVVLLDESPASYADSARSRLEDLVAKYPRRRRGGHAYILAASLLSHAERSALAAAAMVEIHSEAGTRRTSRTAGDESFRDVPPFVPVRNPGAQPVTKPAVPELDYDNGYGGLDRASGEYVIRVSGDSPTPAPWINVLANPNFGSIVSDSGASTTWFGNSSEHRLTPWYNDPVTDPPGEALYLRDEETGEYWSPTPAPAGGACLVRHGAGATRFEHESHELSQTLECVVDFEAPVKYLRLKVANLADRPRRLTVTWFLEWVFGNHFEDMGPWIVPGLSDDGRTLYARNMLPRFDNDRTAFVTSTLPLHGFTTDRREFLGARRDPHRPAALGRIGLSGRIVAGAEPCCAYQVHVELDPGGQAEVCLALGAGEDRDAALALAANVQSGDRVGERISATLSFWADLLSRCVITTPNPALDALFNHWLLYQNVAGRLWARTGLYQSAGGFGFRDQLQDALALVHVRPDILRSQIRRACGVQFVEGDVLHWWHEGPSRGVRTRCSDDLLWLPFAVSDYVDATGDTALLDEVLPYLAGDPLAPEEHERYTEYAPSEQSGGVYEHCLRAIDARSATGINGLPLIGSGDWNDGLNLVGIGGRGESVWLGWFLCEVYTRFARICELRGDTTRATGLRERRAALIDALENKAWDGDWYLRAFYDDGSPLGSANDSECRIDLNAQTWPAITGFATPDRAAGALEAAERLLIDDDERLIRLLTPPFDRTLRDPGYIKGYPPGVRENGGQYTHAATWAVWAAARLGRADKAMRWLDLLNPLLRTATRKDASRYGGEPYVLAGDIWSVEPHTGQSGWTWYTGSAAWLYRIILGEVLGFRLHDGILEIHPCVPDDWRRFDVDYRLGTSSWHIEVRDPARIAADGAVFDLDGERVDHVRVEEDGRNHRVIVSPGRDARPSQASAPGSDF